MSKKVTRDSKNSSKPSKDSPFGVLKDLRSKLVVQEREKSELEQRQRQEKQKKKASQLEESEMLARAMQGVKPLGEAVAPRPKPKAKTGANNPLILGTEDEDDLVMQELRDMVDGVAPLDFTSSDEHVEGRAQDCSHLELSRLRNGDFAIQDHLDLHGKNREEARAALAKFFSESIVRGYRCVLVVCGRGLGSPGGKPVLKELMVRWLVQGQLSYNVLGFCSAKAHDGGVGAVYVLLRRNPRRPKG